MRCPLEVVIFEVITTGMVHAILLTLFSSMTPSDSLRMEMINGKPHVVHQVGEKETLYSLSKRYGTTVTAILAQNPTADAGLEVGQILKVPYVSSHKPVVAVKTADGLVHRVAAKETLFSISRQYNVSVDDIKAWNNLKENSLSLGQEILIRSKTETPVAEAKPVLTTSAKTHTVGPKETLYSIARTYGMSVTQLKEWNSITTDELKIGQVLAVSAAVTQTPPATVPAPVVVAPAITVIDAPATKVTPAESPIRVSESVSGANESRETGFAALLEGTEGNRKYLAQHRTIKPGTILKIRNLLTHQEVFVRVTGPPSIIDDVTIILISKSAYDRLGATESKFNAELTYYK